MNILQFSFPFILQGNKLIKISKGGFFHWHLIVVRKMGILEQKNCVRNSNSKIPEYARNFRNEYLFIRGINKEFKYFVDNINEAYRGLFENHRVDRIKKFIKKFC